MGIGTRFYFFLILKMKILDVQRKVGEGSTERSELREGGGV